MSDILKICALCILSIVLLVILREVNAKMSLMLKLCITVMLFALCVSWLFPIITYVNDLLDKGNISHYASLLIKCLCISLVSNICATVCRDAGEGSVGYFAELFGRIQIIILSLPIVDEILNVALGLLEFM